MIVGSSSDPASCEGIVGSTTLPNCSLFSLGVLTGSNTLEIEFGSNADVALFEFTIAADSDFLALTSSLGLDTMFGLFDSTTKSLSSYFDADNLEWQAFGANIDAVNLNDQLSGVVLAGTVLPRGAARYGSVFHQWLRRRHADFARCAVGM